MYLSSAILASSGLISFTTAATGSERREQVCNGHAEFCDRKYSNVSLIGTHDSAFVGSILDPRINQEKNITQQLDAGIRFLQAQTHLKDDDAIEMCHTSCALEDAGPLETYLSTVKTWLDSHPDDVLTMLLTNGDGIDISNFASVFHSAGLASYAYTPPLPPPTEPANTPLPYDSWPTYSALIANDTRLIIFLDTGADRTSVPYILDEFTHFFETPYDTTDENFPQCDLDRPENSSPDGKMYIVNHFLDVDILGILIPDDGEDYRTNAATGNGSIGAQADLCTAKYGRVPNFVLVDMFDRGDVFTAQNHLNGLS